MKNNESYKDRGLRLALQKKNEAAEKMTVSEDFTDRLMQRIERQEEKPKQRPAWLYTAIGAVAASILLLLTFHFTNHQENIENGTKIAQRTEQQTLQSQDERPGNDGKGQSQQTEQQDISVKPMMKEHEPLIAQEMSGKEKTVIAGQQPNSVSAEYKTSTDLSSTDSLDYYIDKIERELAQVDESLYIERMNKVIRADVRLQRIVNSYILHTLDMDGRPQTADNMYNVKTEQDEE